MGGCCCFVFCCCLVGLCFCCCFGEWGDFWGGDSGGGGGGGGGTGFTAENGHKLAALCTLRGNDVDKLALFSTFNRFFINLVRRINSVFYTTFVRDVDKLTVLCTLTTKDVRKKKEKKKKNRRKKKKKKKSPCLLHPQREG